MPRHKRHRGGQPGNQNARKHGCYAANLSLEELNELYNLINRQNLEPGLAVIRLKLDFIRLNTPGSKRLSREVTGLLYKAFRSKIDFNNLDKEDMAEIKQIVRILKADVFENPHLPEPTEANS